MPQNIVGLRAPIDLRTPISFVRSVTLTSMIFMMPIPAATSAIKLDDERADSNISRHVRERALERVVAVNLENRSVGRAQTTRYPHWRRSPRSNGTMYVSCVNACVAMLTVPFRFARNPRKSRVIGHDAEVVLALAERCPFFCEHADDRVGVSAHANDFADWRFMREQSFLDDLSNDNHAP